MHELLTSNPALAVAAVVGLGVAAQWLAWRARLPAILPLLLGGFLVGPVLGWLRPSAVFGDDLLYPSVSLAVGLVLFEGGLTLRLSELREMRRAVVRLVTVGALVTWLGSAAAAYLLVGLSAPVALLFGALVIVTGPTVVGPLLRIVRPNARVANVLKWEGIVIDAVGAMVAVLAFEVLVIENRDATLPTTILLVLRFLLTGGAVGLAGGGLLVWLLRRRALPDYLVNVAALAALFLAFAGANALTSEAGLLAAVVMGILLANMNIPNIGALLSFKEDLTVLFVSMLFVVLAANIDLATLRASLTWSSVALLAVIVLVVRPLDVFASTLGSPMTVREKLFVSWIAPRGIVAASVTALFASKLTAAGFPGVEPLVPLVFLVIVGTVLLASVTAKPLGLWLGVADPDPQGFLILGAHPAARAVARGLRGAGVSVLLADTNWPNIAAARVEGLPAYYGSLLSDRSDDDLRLSGIGRLLALTPNDEANALTALKFARDFGTQNVYQLAEREGGNERRRIGDERRGRTPFAADATFQRLQRLVAAGAVVKTTDLTERFDFEAFRRHHDGALPLFAVQGRRVRVLGPESAPPEVGATLLAWVVEREEGDEPARAVAASGAA